MKSDSTEVARSAIKVAITSSRSMEEQMIEALKKKGIQSVAVDIGGSLLESIPKIVERALVASKRTGIIQDCHLHDGAVVGAAKEAIMPGIRKSYGAQCRRQNRNCTIQGTYQCLYILKHWSASSE